MRWICTVNIAYYGNTVFLPFFAPESIDFGDNWLDYGDELRVTHNTRSRHTPPSPEKTRY
eukprot:COSAG02_NODE_61758_length_267_cov_1.535714_1_plen_59_part_10